MTYCYKRKNVAFGLRLIADGEDVAHVGANGSSAAGANLTVGKAYASLVDVPSSVLEGHYRVLSGDPENSLMRIILNEGGENTLNYNHTEVLSSTFKRNLSEVRQLIDDWIVSLK